MPESADAVDLWTWTDRLKRDAAGRVTSSFLQLALERGWLRALRGRTATVVQAAALWDMPEPSARLVAQYLSAVGVLQHDAGSIRNHPHAKRFLIDDTTTRQWALVACKYSVTTEQLLESLVQPRSQHWYRVRAGEDAPWSGYRGLHGWRLEWGRQLAEAYDFSGHRLLLDVGGASGGWCLGVRQRFPHLRCVLFDLGPACALAAELIAEARAQEHVQTVCGSFFDDPLPSGADVALLANVLHDWTVADGRQILRNVHRALPPGGMLLVWEFYFDEDWSGPFDAAAQALMVLGAPERCGWQPTRAEMTDLLAAEGFAPGPSHGNLVTARRAS